MSRRGHATIVAAVVVAAALASSALARDANGPQYFPQTPGHPATSPAPLILGAELSSDDAGNVTARIDLGNRTELGAGESVALMVDTDADLATGTAGYDVELLVLGPGIGAYDAFSWRESRWELRPAPSLKVEPRTDAPGIVFHFERGDLGIGDIMRFSLASRASDGAIDQAPATLTAWSFRVAGMPPEEPPAPQPSAQPPVVAARIVAPRTVHRGRLLVARLLLAAPAPGATAACRAVAAGRPLVVVARSVAGRTATCSWSVPRTTRASRIAGAVTATRGRSHATLSFVTRVAA